MTLDTALRPIQRILVGGPPAGGLGATETGIHLAKLLEARLRVVQVDAQQPLLEQLGARATHFADRAAIADADIIRLAHREGLRPSTLETETLRGQPRRVLLEETQRWQADLVIIGTEERRPSGVHLGTIADHLIRHAACPVLVVADGRPMPPRKVLFPVDLSEFSCTAMTCGLGFLEQIGFSAVEGATREALLVVPEISDGSEEEREEMLTASRRELSNWLDGHPDVSSIDRAVASGEPAATIVERAAAGDVDLIVMGTHGYGSRGASMRGIGSVTGQVLGEAPCHFLIVPPVAEFAAEIAEAVVSQTKPRFNKRLFS